MLICGSSFPMQLRIANAEVRLKYADGQTEKLMNPKEGDEDW